MYDTFLTGTWRDTTELLGEKKEEKKPCISTTQQQYPSAIQQHLVFIKLLHVSIQSGHY
jgi:hypothetical protein